MNYDSITYFTIFPFPFFAKIMVYYILMPGSKGLNPHELAHKWVKDLRTHPDMSIKVG